MSTNGRAIDVARSNPEQAPGERVARLERRIAALAEGSERRVAVLRDAVGDYTAAEWAKRDEEVYSVIANTQKRIADLEHQLAQHAAVDRQVAEISARLEEKQAQRDRDKNADGDFIQTMSMMFAQERESGRAEFKAADQEVQRLLEAKLAAVEERLKAVPGKLPLAKIWRVESVTYQGEFVCHEGALYQAKKDTAQAPGGSDWACVARAGRDGLTPTIRGTYDVRENYKMLDFVAMDCGSFVAKRDDPGICPGDGWQLLSTRGQSGRKGDTGQRGMRGERGEKGDTGPSIVSWQIDPERYRASPLMSNGTVGPMLELRELFVQFLSETSS